MTRMHGLGPLVLLMVLLLAVSAAAQEDGVDLAADPYYPDRPWQAVDLAIILDTSDSMENLIEAARLSLWDIVNELNRAEPKPELRVAVLAYGNRGYDRKSGWVRVETDFTTDLDSVSERLFELTTDGGTEYVSRALETAVEKLSWVPSHDALKFIFVAGNEPADQDPEVDYRDAGALAADQGISVTAIFCGNPNQDQAQTWRELALRSDGRFVAIDNRSAAVRVQTPYDDELARLSEQLTKTFIPLGEAGRSRQQSLERQDANAARLSPAAAAGRARTKADPSYSAGWELISVLDGGKALSEIDERDLPEELRRISVEEREAYIAEQRTLRAQLQREIAELSAERRRDIIEQVEAKGIDTSKTFDTAVREAIRSEAEGRGYVIPED